MAKIVFNAEKREKAGKGAARAVRREGRIPAVIYGGKQEPMLVSLHPVELEKALEKRDFYKSDIEVVVGGKAYKVVCQDVQFHVVTDFPIHVDFLRK
ncbi:MAG: 50S ribosomal protein L25 [Lactobacillaceae bacterium]|jgi:large subunit ribosomal protein L25|nr:50S ribosomal protein L25 [Lactobacillaceae bacterium]